VVTTPGVTLTDKTYTSLAEFVQIRDITLSGLFVALYNLAPGAWGMDASRYSQPETLGRDWEPLVLRIRLSLGASLLESHGSLAACRYAARCS
jgi:hypothetical protein